MLMPSIRRLHGYSCHSGICCHVRLSLSRLHSRALKAAGSPLPVGAPTVAEMPSLPCCSPPFSLTGPRPSRPGSSSSPERGKIMPCWFTPRNSCASITTRRSLALNPCSVLTEPPPLLWVSSQRTLCMYASGRRLWLRGYALYNSPRKITHWIERRRQSSQRHWSVGTRRNSQRTSSPVQSWPLCS